ncbi:MAG: hypothetical protein C4288_08865 [Leptolyngbya sp. ERB_1_1]
MTQANEPNDRDREIDRQFTSLNRRVDRLEYSQISPQELSRGFDRVYDEIDSLENHMNARFDRVNERFDQIDQRFDRLEGEVRELNRKFDIVMLHITGQGGTSRNCGFHQSLC